MLFCAVLRVVLVLLGLTMSITQSAIDVRDECKKKGGRGCAICGATQWTAVYPQRLPWLHECPGCRIRRVYPPTRESRLDAIYGEEYFARFGATNGLSPYSAMKLDNARRFFKTINTVMSPGNLLDIGCGLGETLLGGLEAGWQVQGIDRNEKAVDACNSIVPDCATLLDWELAEWPPESVNLVTFCDVIEHLARPEAALHKAWESLKSGGVLFVTTPDVSSFFARWCGHRWWHYHIDHLWYFSRSTLCRMAQDVGFEVIKCIPTKKTFTWDYIFNTIGNSEEHVFGKWLCRGLVSCVPKPLLAWRLPGITEGITLVARKVGK